MFEAGQYIEVAEDDYKFGVGMLRLHVSQVLEQVQLDGALWRRLVGFEQRWDGTVSGREREALVRVAVLPVVRGR